MPDFSIHSAAFLNTTTYKTIARLATIAGVPIELWFCSLTGAGSVAPNATDCQHELAVHFLDATTAGTFTGYTPVPLDSSGAAARGTYGVNGTGSEVTAYQTNPFIFGSFNQRIGYTFGLPQGKGHKTRFDALSGFKHIGIRTKSSLGHYVDLNAYVNEP